jgi:hypothetical protein
MARKLDAMHVARIPSRYVDKAGVERRYESVLLRRTFREDGKVKHETLANLSVLPDEQIELLARSLKGEAFVSCGATASVLRSLPHGHVAAVMAQARALGFPALLGRPVGRGSWRWR